MLGQYLSEIEKACTQFKKNIDDISTLYLASEASAKLLATIQLPDNLDWEMRMSDNFHRSATTIRNTDDVLHLLSSGEYERLNAYQAVVSICSVFEEWAQSVSQLISAKKLKCVTIVSWRRKNKAISIENKTLCAISAVHKKFNLDSQLCKDEALCWIYNFFLIRNTVVHQGGILTENVHRRLVGTWSRKPIGQKLTILGNDIDDMVHFMKSNVGSFIYEVRKQCGES